MRPPSSSWFDQRSTLRPVRRLKSPFERPSGGRESRRHSSETVARRVSVSGIEPLSSFRTLASPKICQFRGRHVVLPKRFGCCEKTIPKPFRERRGHRRRPNCQVMTVSIHLGPYTLVLWRPGRSPGARFALAPRGSGCDSRGMETRGFIRRRGFWLLALLWLPAGVMATAAVRFGPGTGSVPPGMWVMAMLMSGGGAGVRRALRPAAGAGLPAALASGLPPRRLVGGHRARCCHGGGVAVGGGCSGRWRSRSMRP